MLAQSGTFVAEIDRAQVEEAYIVRIALECESVARAAPLMSDDALAEPRGHHRSPRGRPSRRGRFDEAIARDDDFHRYITQISGLAMLWRVVDTCKAQMDRCRMLTVPRPGHGTLTIEQHRAIVAALATASRAPPSPPARASRYVAGQFPSWFDERDSGKQTPRSVTPVRGRGSVRSRPRCRTVGADRRG